MSRHLLVIQYWACLTDLEGLYIPGWRARGFRLLRWLDANRERSYMNIENCNALAEHFYWHEAVEFSSDSCGWPLSRIVQ